MAEELKNQIMPSGTSTPQTGSGNKPTEMSVTTAEMKKKGEMMKRQREIIHAREEDTKLSSRLGDLILPLVILGVIALIISFILIPFSTQIVENRKQSAKLMDEIKVKREKVKTLKSIRVEELERNLRTVTKVIGDDKNVSALANEIDYLAIENNLVPESEEITNRIVIDKLSQSLESEDLDWKPERSDSLVGPFSFYGSFEDISNFINDLRLRSATILSLGEVYVSQRRVDLSETNVTPSENGAESAWSIAISVKGFTVKPVTRVGIDDTVIIKLNENIMKEISERASYNHTLSQENTSGEEQEDQSAGETEDQ